MDFLKFLISKTFFKNLLLAAAIALVILLVTMIVLKIYTHHGHSISVPNFTGLTIDEVDDVASSRRLNYEVIDSIFSTDMPRGTVLKQNPKPSSKVKIRRKIFITMNAINAEQVSMPNLVSLSDRQAILAIENAGLVLGEISYRLNFAVNSVLQQNINGNVIEEGTMIEKGSSINLVLGMGLSNEKTIVPDLDQLNLMMTKLAITERFLNFGLATYDESVVSEEDSLNAWVYRQNPDYNGLSSVQKGIEVFVWLTVDSTLLPIADTLIADPIADDEDEFIY